MADELIEAGATPRTLMKAQGFDPAPLALLKANFNQAQPRWAAGSGRDSGRWSGGASIDTAGIKEFIARLLLEAARRAARALLRPSKPKPPTPESGQLESKPAQAPLTSTPKSSLVGNNAKIGSGGIKTDLPGGLDEAKDVFQRLTKGQTIGAPIVDKGTTMIRASDGTQLRINANGAVRIDRPIDIDGQKIETIHFNRQ
ncbi:MAG: hypothetical protein WBF43_08090 [Methylocella sp.]